MNFKNILFDLGGVLFDIDIQRSETCFRKLLGDDFNLNFYKTGMADVFKNHEKGIINGNQFVATIDSWSDHRLESTAVVDAWNALLIGIPKHRFELLDQLKEKFNLYLLSNTNDIHLEWIAKDHKKRWGIDNFDKRFFIKSYYSNQLKMRKPDIKIYEYVCQDAGIIPAETIFIDDNAANIEGAKKAGLQTHLHDPKLEIADFFKAKI